MIVRYIIVLFALIGLLSCRGTGDSVSRPFGGGKDEPVLEIEVINDSDFEAELVKIINDRRQELELPVLITNTLLMQVAEAHSLDMANGNYLSHEGQNGDHANERLTKGGYRWRYWGEVIAGGSRSPQETFEGWMASPQHKTVLLDGVYEEIGIGYAVAVKETKYVRYWTAVVAIPRQAKSE